MKLFSPAKINLFLAVTGRRADGFHRLVSLVAPLAFGDDLEIRESDEDCDLLRCDQKGVPTGGENLILRAAELFRRETGVERYFHFDLHKRIPIGGGFGGGSSNAVCALRGINRYCGDPLGVAGLHKLAAELGSDCPLFLHDGPVVIRGRGEEVEPVSTAAAAGLGERKVHLFNPGFFSSTAALFAKMAERGNYTDPETAERRLREVLHSLESGKDMEPAVNDLGEVLAEKYMVYGALFAECRRLGFKEYGITGSGCGAFLLSRNESDFSKIDDFGVFCGMFSQSNYICADMFHGANSWSPKPSNSDLVFSPLAVRSKPE